MCSLETYKVICVSALTFNSNDDFTFIFFNFLILPLLFKIEALFKKKKIEAQVYPYFVKTRGVKCAVRRQIYSFRVASTFFDV
jgi:hypothetical protein